MMTGVFVETSRSVQRCESRPPTMMGRRLREVAQLMAAVIWS